jgi:hypothetical protein
MWINATRTNSPIRMSNSAWSASDAAIARWRAAIALRGR